MNRASNTKRVLIVEDEPPIRNMMELMFTRYGFEVHLAATGEDALAMVEKVGYGVIFVDLNLPGMNGVTLCRRIRALHSDACVYAVTGYADPSDIHQIEAAGFSGHFLKPVPVKILLGVAERAFAAPMSGF